jgi:hypothetical protein
MIDVLIRNSLGTAPVATARSNDAIGANDLRVTVLEPENLINLGDDYMVGLDDGTQMNGRTCTAKAHNTATFTRHP